MKLSSIYERMPLFIQNIGVSVYGLLRENRRYGGEFKKDLSLVNMYEYADAKTIHELQEEKLKELLVIASSSEHYSNLFYKYGVDVRKDDPFEVLGKLPILEKSDLRGYEGKFHTSYAKGALHFHTSGSTGTPLSILMSRADLQMRMAVLERQKKRFGVDHRSRQISFVGKKITSKESKTFWRNNIFGNQLVMSVYDLSLRNKQKYIDKIYKYNPEVIEGYPSAISIIGKWLTEDDVKLSIKCVFVTAESLSTEQRAVIEKGFHCPVVNYYGSAEGATMITQCEKGHLHIDMETGLIEFINDEGKPAAPGDVARMVITSFTTRAMPLIRYNIGDLAIVQGDKCDCGRSSPVIKEIYGRIDDVFETAEKGYIGRLSTTLKLLPPIVRKAQIHQYSPEEFLLLLESDEKIPDDDLKTVMRDLYDKLGTVKINVEYTSKIPCGKNGKFRAQIKHF